MLKCENQNFLRRMYGRISLRSQVRMDFFINLQNTNSIKEKTDAFDKWFRKLNDLKAKAKILFRLQKLEKEGHFGDCKSIWNGIHGLWIHYAKGYRIYFKEVNGVIIILLIGGNKSSQQQDIEKEKIIWEKIKIKYEYYEIWNSRLFKW